MRDLLTGLAIILIVVLTTILVAPYFVDWNAQRGFLEGQLTRALGQTVTIGGNIDLKLLPTPYLRLNQTVIGADDGAVRVGIDHLDLELAVAPLLHGEIDIVEGLLDQPNIRVTLRPDRSLPALPPTPALMASLRFDRLTIVDGTLAIADPSSGRTTVFNHLDATGEAPSLAGPIKASGSIGSGRGRTQFRFNTTEAKGDATHLHATIDQTAFHPAVDLDGTLTFARARDAVRPQFAGRATATGALASSDLADGARSLPWRLSATVDAGPEKLSMADGTLSLGPEDAAVSLAATGSMVFGDDPAMDVSLKADQLDIDRLAGPIIDGKTPPPPHLPDLRALRRAVEAELPELPLTLEIDVAGAIWGGETIEGIHLHLQRDARRLQALVASGNVPGGTHFAVDIASSVGKPWSGSFDISVADLPKALRWFDSVDEHSPLRARDLPFASAAATGRVTESGPGFAVADLRTTLDRNRLTGTARWTPNHAGEAPSLALVLATHSLDLGALPSLHLLAPRATPFDLDLSLAADALVVTQAGTSTVELKGGPLSLALTRTGRRTELRSFEARDLGGATIAATGTISPTGDDLSAHVEAAKVEDMAALLRRFEPGSATDAFAARASALSPAILDVKASFAASGKTIRPRRLDLKGSVGGTAIDARLGPATGDAMALSAVAHAPDGAVLLRQLGASVPPSTTVKAASAIGSGTAELVATGELDQPLVTHLQVGLGQTRFEVGGRFDLFGQGRGGSGSMKLASPDLAPVLAGVGLQALGGPAPIPVDVSGGIAASRSGVALSALRGTVAGTGVAGTLKWQAEPGDAPALTGSVDLDSISMPSVLGLVLGRSQPAKPGEIWSSAPFGQAVSTQMPTASVDVHAKTLELGLGLMATATAMELSLAPGVLRLEHAEGDFRGGRLSGDLTLRRDGATATMTASLDAKTASFDLPSLSGEGSAKLSLAGGGVSPAAVVANLAGAGQAHFSKVELPHADGAALSRVFVELENDTLAVDDLSISRALDEAAKAPYREAGQSYDLGLAAGVVAFAPSALGGAGQSSVAVSGVLDGDLDLRRLSLDLRLSDVLHDLPKDWSGPPPRVVLDVTGPIDAAPTRHWDTSGLIDAVSARAIARETARIEAFEVDVRERAFLNEQLQSERRRALDRAKAEADALAAERKAEAERRAAAAAKEAAKEAARKAAAAAALSDADRDAGAPPPSGNDRSGVEPLQIAPKPAQPAGPGSEADPSAAGRY